MKKLAYRILSVALLTGATNLSLAADKVLTVASWLPRTHAVNDIFWETFQKEVKERTQGRVEAKIEYGLAPPNGLLELIEYGGADIAWTYNGYFPGRFTTTKMIELPGYPGDSEAASVAHWRAHEKFFKTAGEYDGVELIGMMVHAPAYLFMAEDQPVNHLTELEGRKMRTGGGMANEVAEALGVSPILASATKSYEMISGGMADGTFLPMDVVPAFRLYEAAPKAYSVPGGFYRGSFSIFMSEDAMNGISDADQEALQAYFGELLSRDAGRAWQAGHERGLKKQQAEGTVTALSEADVSDMSKKTAAIKSKLIKEISDRGIDAQAAYDFIFDTMKNYQSQ